MALKVWLPLNGNLDNKGISDYEIRSANITIADDGKIGKCYSFNGSNSYINITNFEIGNNWSYGCWVNTPNSDSRGWEIVMILNNSGSDADSQFAFWVHQKENRFESLANTQYVSTIPYTNYYNNWHHFFATFNGTLLTTYIDGNVVNTKTITATQYNAVNLTIGARSTNAAGTSFASWFQGKLNDIRVYDHCLSPLEVKEISQGLVLHYKLNQNSQILDNCYSYPTFNTSSASGGWSHWGRTGHAGSQGQNTDKTYIYNKQNAYSHWVNNAATATGEYLVYQSPAFDGGYRSLQAIIKEENGELINETICFPDWNARNGGAENGLWTSITSLGDGFYLCKCEGISQDGSNDLVGIYVTPGYKIYISEAYLENNKQLCSEILYPRNYIIDSSGYGNNGTIIGTLTTSEDTERYNKSTSFAASSAINCGRGAMVTDSITVNLWAKYSSYSNLMSCTEGGGWNFENNSGLTFPVYIASIGYIHIDAAQRPAVANYANNWHMFTGIYDRLNQLTKLYIDGELIGTGTVSSPNLIQYNGANVIWINAEATGSNTSGSYGNAKSISDVRIYATALSAEDILDLYHTSANIDNLQNMHTFEFRENSEKTSIYQNGITSTTNEIHESNAELLNTMSIGGYTPAKNIANSCTNFGYANFDNYASLGKDLAVHIECDVEWTAFTADTGGTFKGVWFQGANYEKASNSFKWAGTNYICSALNSAFSLQTISAITTAGKHRYDITATIPASWFATYSRSNLGWRCDYSDGTGHIDIKNLKITPLQYYNAKIGEDFISANNFIEK